MLKINRSLEALVPWLSDSFNLAINREFHGFTRNVLKRQILMDSVKE